MHFWFQTTKGKNSYFQKIQFSVSTSIWAIDRTLSGSITPYKSEAWSDGNEGILRIPQIPSKLEAYNQIV